MERYNESKLNTLLTHWSNISWMKRRIPIISQVFKAHIQGDYFLSVATILPQIEGIFADATDHVGNMNIRKKITTILNTEDKAFSFDKEIQSFYLNIILHGFEHNTTPLPVFSRHAILHGADIKYGNVENSVKSIMLLEFIVKKLEDYQKEKTQV